MTDEKKDSETHDPAGRNNREKNDSEHSPETALEIPVRRCSVAQKRKSASGGTPVRLGTPEIDRKYIPFQIDLDTACASTNKSKRELR
jgi:hypothetical protein